MVKLSASRIKTLNTCSWLYRNQYVTKLPRTSNDGARRGTTVHLLLEVLLNPRHKHHYDKIRSTGKISSSPACERLIRKTMKKEGITDDFENNYNMINDFTIVGLGCDFFMEGYKMEKPEYAFDIKTEKFHIVGFLDRVGLSDNVVKIQDWKSSKSKFAGEEARYNIQGLMYQVAASYLWPQFKKSFVDFIFLKFKKSPMQVFSGSREQVKGFEVYLEYLTEYLEDFDFKKAVSSFAADDFRKKNLCGTMEDRFNEDGKPKWRCGFMKPFEYYVLMEGDKDITSSMEESGFKLREGQHIEKRSYLGCPKFNPANYRNKL